MVSWVGPAARTFGCYSLVNAYVCNPSAGPKLSETHAFTLLGCKQLHPCHVLHRKHTEIVKVALLCAQAHHSAVVCYTLVEFAFRAPVFWQILWCVSQTGIRQSQECIFCCQVFLRAQR